MSNIQLKQHPFEIEVEKMLDIMLEIKKYYKIC